MGVGVKMPELDKATQKRIIKVAIKMTRGHHTLKELGCTLEDVRVMKDLGYRVIDQQSPSGRVYYIGSPDESPYVFISRSDTKEQELKWLELSDTHAGCKAFDEEGLKEVLKRAEEEGVKDVHISGDLCDGNRVYPGQQRNLKYWKCEDQANLLAEILLQFDFTYYAVKGNHDESYEKQGSPNPVRLIESLMTEEGRSFTFLDSMAGDLIYGGIVKRMVHLDGGKAYAKSYPGQVYLRNLFDSHGEDVWVRGNKYRIRFGQFGHFHSNVIYESNGIYCSHPGNFQFPSDFTIRRGLVGDQGARVTRCLIQDRHVYEYSSTFIKPRRRYRTGPPSRLTTS